MLVGDFKPGKPGVVPQPCNSLEAVGDPQELAGRKQCCHADLLTLDTSVTNCSSDRYRRDPNSHRISSNMGTFLKTVKTRDSSPLFKESR